MKSRTGMTGPRALLSLGVAVLASGAVPVVAQAQSAGQGELNRHLLALESNPKNFEALVAAGDVALEMGDIASAAGFFGRAAEVRPRDPRPIAGMGSVAALMNDAPKAMTYFATAQSLGHSVVQMGAGRGLAYDLQGRADLAEQDYRAAMQGPQANSARRRLALNLAMGGDRTAAMAILGPLVATGDPAALRARAFVLALTGDYDNARRAIETAMPGAGARIDPFLRKLPSLSAQQKAAAVHLGVFPSDSEIAMAAARQQQSRAAIPVRPSQREVEQRQTASRNAPAQERNNPPPSVNPPAAASEPVRVARLQTTVRRDAEDGGDETRRESDARSTRLAGIDAILDSTATNRDEPALGTRVAALEPPPPPMPKYDAPPPPRPKYEAPPKPTPKVETASKPAPAAPEIGIEGDYFVQIAGGAKPDAMPYEWRRLSRKAPTALDGKDGLVTRGATFHRLLVGPFSSKAQAQQLVNQLKAEGVDSFAWTRNPSQLRIDRL